MKTKTVTSQRHRTMFGYEAGYFISSALMIASSIIVVLLVNFRTFHYGPFRKYMDSDNYYQELEFDWLAFLLIVGTYIALVAVTVAVTVHRKRTGAGYYSVQDILMQTVFCAGITQVILLLGIGIMFNPTQVAYGHELTENAVFVTSPEEAEEATTQHPAKTVFLIEENSEGGLLVPNLISYEQYAPMNESHMEEEK